MISAKKTFTTAALALLMGGAALVTTAAPAAARLVCNREGDCWHTDTAPRVPACASMSIRMTGISTSIGMAATAIIAITTKAVVTIRAASGSPSDPAIFRFQIKAALRAAFFFSAVS